MDYLNGLNEKQIETVKCTEGYLRVIAGAGSGKTKVLVNRYAYLVKEYGVDPFNILCVTFTNKAAQEMKNRIRGIIGNNLSNGLICTYHGLCVRIIKENYEKLFLSKNFQILDEYQQKTILDEIYQKYEIKFNYASFEKTLKVINDYKICHNYVPLLINPNNTKIIDKIDNLDLQIVEDYLQRQKIIHGLDFNDLIYFALYLLDNYGDIRSKWQNRLNYIMVDEFQDSSKIEMRLLDILLGKNKNLMVVGDPDQNIYEWRGSDNNILTNFDSLHNPTKTIILDKNYRSTREILSCANSLIDKNKIRIKKNLYTDNNKAEDVIHYHLKDSNEENDIINKEIKRLINQYNYSYSDIAILYRSSFLSRNIEKGLIKNNIPYTIYGGVKFYQRMEILDILAYLKLICFNDDISFKRIINVPRRRFGKNKMNYLLNLQANDNKNYYDLLVSNKDSAIFKNSDINLFIEMVEAIRNKMNNMKLSDIFSYVLNESGYDKYIRELGDEERLDNVVEFKRMALEFESLYGEDYSLEEFLNEITISSEEDINNEKDQVKLMTIHSSKGLEFKVVFIIGLSEGIFPSSRTLDEREELGLEEERRLCYVAITRAKSHLFLIDKEEINNLPSRFLFEIGENNYVRIGKISEEIMELYKDYLENEDIKFNNVYKIGDKVNHHIFGDGIIIDIDEKRNSYLIKFDKLESNRSISKSYFIKDKK